MTTEVDLETVIVLRETTAELRTAMSSMQDTMGNVQKKMDILHQWIFVGNGKPALSEAMAQVERDIADLSNKMVAAEIKMKEWEPAMVRVINGMEDDRAIMRDVRGSVMSKVILVALSFVAGVVAYMLGLKGGLL